MTKVSVLDDLDYRIAVAYIELGQARTAWAHSPNTERADDVELAEAVVNGLLEQRSDADR